MTVHNHGPHEGRGLDCPERVVDGKLRGACLDSAAPDPSKYRKALDEVIAAHEAVGWMSDVAGDRGWTCLCGTDVGLPPEHPGHVADALLASPVLAQIVADAKAAERERVAWARAEAEDERAAKKVAADSADRFRDVLSECLGHTDENPGDDVLVAELRQHFGKTGPEPTRWRDFLTGALAVLDQIHAEPAPRIAREPDTDRPDTAGESAETEEQSE